MKKKKKSLQTIGRVLQAVGESIANLCLLLINVILLFGPVIIGIVASIYIGGLSGVYVTREIFGNGWWVPVSAFVGFGLVLTFLQNYVYNPHIFPAFSKAIDVLRVQDKNKAANSNPASLNNKPSSKTAEMMTIQRINMLADFGSYIEENSGETRIHDQSKLPHPKETIFNAICLELMRDPDPKRQELLLNITTILCDFQPGVGDEPLWIGGIRPNKPMPHSREERDEFFRGVIEYAESQADRWTKFNKLFEDDYKTMRAESLKAIEIGRLMSPEIKKGLFGSGVYVFPNLEGYHDRMVLLTEKLQSIMSPQASKEIKLGHILGNVAGTIPQNDDEAVKIFRNLATHPATQCFLGDVYRKGEDVPQDMTEAAQWYLKAADQGNAEAQLMIGAMYHNGEGLEKDYVQGWKWSDLAATQGNQQASEIRDYIASRMPPEQIAEARRLAQEWKAI